MAEATGAHQEVAGSAGDGFVALLRSLHVDPLGEGHFVASPLDRGGVIDAGSVSALITAAAAASTEDVRAVHADFMRPAKPGQPVEIEARDVHRGRSLALKVVTVAQGGRLVAHAQVSCGPAVEDLLTQAVSPDPPAGPPGAGRLGERYGPHVRIVGAADPFDPLQTHPPRWQVWVDCAAASACGVLAQSAIAFHANQYLVSAAVLPHRGFSMQDAHREVLTVITSSTVTFHRPVGSQWLLFDQASTYAGGGWLHGRGEAFGEAGELVASFSQAAIMRRAPGLSS